MGLWQEYCLLLPVVQNLRHISFHQDLCCNPEVLEGNDVVVAHVEGVGVALGYLLLELIVREAKQLEEAG